jgi:uncharacterized protein
MNKTQQAKLVALARERQTRKDPSHYFQHVWRVYQLALQIGEKEGADMDILVPTALFHDVVVYLKNHPRSQNAAEESAQAAGRILENLKGYPKGKIEKVQTCIRQCSFSKALQAELLEAKILQDADMLEATGAISIMRTFSSGGQMNRPFYDPRDPFCEKGSVEFRSDLDLFYRRLLVVEERMSTSLAKRMARRRTAFLRKFLEELREELEELKVI